MQNMASKCVRVFQYIVDKLKTLQTQLQGNRSGADRVDPSPLSLGSLVCLGQT